MNAPQKATSLIVIATACLAISSFQRVGVLTPTAVGAADLGSFGEKKGVRTAEDASKALKKYSDKNNLIIGEVSEKELYFEAEIKDRKNTVIDKVIIDKRTGRIRSVY